MNRVDRTRARVTSAVSRIARFAVLLALGLAMTLVWRVSSADTTVTLFNSFAGNINFIGTQRTLRTQSDAGDSCAVTGGTTMAALAGLPVGATVTAAYLYWAGSGNTPDYNVSFEGNAVAAAAARRYTATFSLGGTDYNYFSGVVDVTATVAAKGNGTYSFAGLTVDNGNPWCASSAVLAGWALLVVYSDPAEDFRVINVYEGLQHFRGSNITLTPSNFLIPVSPINGKDAHLTWEGDVGNSASLNGFNEELTFNGTVLTDANNPANNQFNSVSTINADAASYGVDFDVYDISAYLAAGQTSATTVYSSGGDLVLLSAQIISTTNTPVADLAISMTRSGDLVPGQSASYTLDVTNNGPLSEPGPITVVDTLPAGLTYVSASGTGWVCSAAGQAVTCDRAGALASGASASAITLTVAVGASATGAITNSATVSGQRFDNDSSNDTATDTFVIPGSAYAYYAMDGFIWNGTANEVVDSSGNNRHGVRVGSANTVNPGKVCRGGDIPDDNSAIDTGIDINTALGNRGTITFWYKSDTDWDDGNERMLLDASNDLGNGGADKYFFLVKDGNGQLHFLLEDSGDTDTEAATGNNSFAAGTWVHIAITWDLPNDRTEIYINGVLEDASNTNVNGTLGNTDTLYLGDNRSFGVFGSGYTTQSANGVLDEVRIYDSVVDAAGITADMNATHTCPAPPPGLNYFDILVPTYATVCGPATITIVAKDAGGGTVTDYTGLVNLSTSTNDGDWSVSVAAGTLNNGGADDGAATYQFVLADAGTIQLSLAVTNEVNLTVTVQDPSLGVSNTTASINFRRGSRTLLITNDPIQVAGRPQAMTVARLRNNCSIDTGFNGARNMEAWITRDVSDPGGAAPSINGVALPNAAPGFDNLTGGNALTFVNGVASFGLATTDVGKYILEMVDGGDRGSSDSITTRPWLHVAVAGNPGGSAPGSSVFTSAGTDFSGTVRGVRWQAGDDANNDGVADAGANLTDNLATSSYAWATTLSSVAPYTPATGILGALSNGAIVAASFSGGSATVANLRYAEVGSFTLRAAASNYLNTAGANLTATYGPVGRFTPARYAVTASTITPACTAGPTDFTYARQPFSGTMTIQAQTAGGARTQNFRDGFDTLNPASELTFTNSATGLAYDDKLIGVVAGQGFSDAPTGEANLTLQFRWDMPQQAPANSTVQLTGATDEVTAVAGSPYSVGTTNVRFGRLFLQNAIGSELLPLSMPMLAQRYVDVDTGFVVNGDDACTTITTADLDMSNDIEATTPTITTNNGPPPKTTTATIANSTFVSGNAGLSFSAPGEGGDGYVNVTIDLSAAGLNMPWLQFDWDGSGAHDNNPSARATFGIYRGNPRHIYLRERY